MAVYIYGLKCPLANVIRYVGKSTRPLGRLHDHLRDARKYNRQSHASKWLRKLIRNGLKPELIILHEVQPRESWKDLEREFILSGTSRGWKLTNCTAGGDGLEFINEAARKRYLKKLSKVRKQQWDRPDSVFKTEEYKANHRAAMNTPEYKAIISQRSLRAWRNPENRKERIRKLVENNTRPEVIAAKAATMKSAWADPLSRAKRCASMSREITKERMSDSAKAKWADPVKGPRLRAAASSPEKRRKLSEAANRRATPEYRAMMAEVTRKSWEKRRRKSD